MNNFFKQLLGSLVQIGINELSRKTPVAVGDSPFKKEAKNNVRKEEQDDSGKNFSVRVSRRGQQHQELENQKS